MIIKGMTNQKLFLPLLSYHGSRETQGEKQIVRNLLTTPESEGALQEPPIPKSRGACECEEYKPQPSQRTVSLH